MRLEIYCSFIWNKILFSSQDLETIQKRVLLGESFSSLLLILFLCEQNDATDCFSQLVIQPDTRF